jgi:transcriptional regulator with XRE-family HTH domain
LSLDHSDLNSFKALITEFWTVPLSNFHSDTLATQNLRAIWDRRKRELGITQVEAAKALGLTQGALSQYLNGTIKLAPPAIIKLARYLEVEPSEIDPDIDSNMKNALGIDIRFNFSDATKKIEQYGFVGIDAEVFGIVVDNYAEFTYPDAGAGKSAIGRIHPGAVIAVIETKKFREGYFPAIVEKDWNFCLVQEHGQKSFSVQLVPKNETVIYQNYAQHLTALYYLLH